MNRRYSKEEIELANSYSLPDLLRKSGYILVPDRRGEYHLQEHDSLKISEHAGWKWFSRDMGGKNIDFFMKYENRDFISAVDKIFSLTGDLDRKSDAARRSAPENSAKHSPEKVNVPAERDREEVPFKLPEKNENNRRVYAYLVKTRCLDPALVKGLLDSGYVYESENTHNAVFVGTDYEGNITSAFERGTGTKKFARDAAGSNKCYRLRVVSPGSKKVNVFEAEIDMLSYISMHGIRNENYIALGGISPLALDTFMKESGLDIDSVNLCLDNDDAGIVAADLIKNELQKKGDYIITREVPSGKDFNEDLQRQKSVEQVKEAETECLYSE